MISKIIIPTAEPAVYNRQYKGVAEAATNIVPGKVLSNMPAPVAVVGAALVNTPTPLDIINAFLREYPQTQEPIPEKTYITPAYSNTMQTVAGATLAGGPLYANIEFTGQSWQDFSGVTLSYPDMIFNTVIIRVIQQKNIIKTQIQGSDNGAVLEYSGLNNYDVSIDIIVVGNNINGVYPRKAVDQVKKMLEAPIPLKVTSWYLQMLGIFELVVMDYDISQKEGGISQQTITINCTSNKASVLIIQ